MILPPFFCLLHPFVLQCLKEFPVQLIFFVISRKHSAEPLTNCLKYCFLGDTKPVKCPEEWVAYTGHCYRIYRTPKIWKQAQSSCRKEDGDLTSIHNVEEYSFIVSQLGYSEYSHKTFLCLNYTLLLLLM